ncbi:MAG TPA: hypothetical protein ENK73_07265 [Thiomicrospira sp.]|nr:hypothetical protein [Thiomicrospira sp.]
MDNLQIGTYGWQKDSWIGSFYPDDLPEDWMLEFYANAYRVVLVPEQAWLNWDDEVINETLDAVEGAFSFYFEVSNQFDEAKIEQLDKINNAISVIAAEENPEICGGVILFSEELSAAHAYSGLPLTLVSNSQTIDGWQWQNQNVICSGEPCGVLFELDDNAKQQRAILQSFMQSLPEGTMGAPLLLRKENIDMQQVFTLKTIAEFLGY